MHAKVLLHPLNLLLFTKIVNDTLQLGYWDEKIGWIKPIYKNKENTSNINSFRSINVLSVFNQVIAFILIIFADNEFIRTIQIDSNPTTRIL